MRLHPFASLLPAHDKASQVAAPPYDVVNRAEARAIAAGNPASFLHVGRSDIDLPDSTDQYDPAVYRTAREALDRLGFQRQSGPDSLPETRPTRVGMVEHLGRMYRIHTHVAEAGSAAGRDLVRFRDLLRANAGLQRAYEMEKCKILVRDISHGSEYAQAKGEFIRRVLRADRF